MRQIEEFSSSYRNLANNCIAWIAGLIAWVWISILLHMNGLDMRLLYTVVAAAIGIRICRSITGLNEEARRTSSRYKSYLDTFSYPVLHRMRKDSYLSAWSKREIEKYLNRARSWVY